VQPSYWDSCAASTTTSPYRPLAPSYSSHNISSSHCLSRMRRIPSLSHGSRGLLRGLHYPHIQILLLSRAVLLGDSDSDHLIKSVEKDCKKLNRKAIFDDFRNIIVPMSVLYQDGAISKEIRAKGSAGRLLNRDAPCSRTPSRSTSRNCCQSKNERFKKKLSKIQKIREIRFSTGFSLFGQSKKNYSERRIFDRIAMSSP
jgi:hypothetical protein